MQSSHTSFAGSVPQNYDQYLGPFLFEPYAVNLVQHIDIKIVNRVLEIACGTGRVTKHLEQHFDTSVEIIASDFNEGMLNIARKNLDSSRIKFIQADAQALPFKNDYFDLIVCQFGFMFVPDKHKAFHEAFRVLKKGGRLLFNTWDKLENNMASYLIKEVISDFFKNDAHTFFHTPFSMYNKEELNRYVHDAGFQHITIEQVTIEGTISSGIDMAKGFILGTPAYNEIMKADPSSTPQLIELATKKYEEYFGKGIIKTTLNAWVCQAVKL